MATSSGPFTDAPPFELPGFTYHPAPYGGLAFRLPSGATPAGLQTRFRDLVLEAVGTRYLPVYRMADGEFTFMVGERGVVPGGPLDRVRALPRRWYDRVTGRTVTCWGEAYSGADRPEAVRRFTAGLARVAGSGFLAPYFVQRADGWAAAYYEPVCKWLAERGIRLAESNYIPFYGVYALLTGPDRRALFPDRRLLVVTHAGSDRRQALRRGLLDEGARAVEFLPVSPSRSLLDDIDPAPYAGRVDLALVAAGIGSVNVLAQLAPLGVPAIDCGIALECYVDAARRWERPFLIGDDRADPATIAARRRF